MNNCNNCPNANQEICCQAVRKSPLFAAFFAMMIEACLATKCLSDLIKPRAEMYAPANDPLAFAAKHGWRVRVFATTNDYGELEYVC